MTSTTEKLLSFDIPLFADVSPETLERRPPVWSERTFKAGQTLISQHDPSRDVYFLLSGMLSAVYFTQDGREVIFSRIAAGTYLGELSAIDGGDRSLAVFARVASRVVVMEQASFLALVDTVPQIRQRLLHDMASRIRSLTQKMLELSTFSVEQRVCAHILRLALGADCLHPGGQIPTPPTHAEIAASIGANREMVSRTIARLAKNGILKSGRQKIELLQPEALEDLISGID